MWIVRVALSRPYTFIVLALLILIASPVVVLRTPTDVFPNIDIPVIAVAWQFTGLNPEEMEGRITTQYERVLTTTVDNIEHIESTTVNGQAMVKIFLEPHARLDTANAQVTAVSQTILRQLPPGTQPPLIINYSASTVPILQLALSGLSESELNDAGLNFLRTQLVTVPGASIPYPYGGKQRQIMVDLDQRLLQSKGLSPADVVTALGQQNIVLPSGTAKIGEFEYDVAINASPRTVAELNDLPVKVVGNSTIYLRDVAHVRDGFAPQTNVVRRDGLALPGELAEHAHHRGLHPALDPDVGHHPQPARRDHQHHDARWARARRRHPRGRRHRGGREHQPQPRHGQARHPGHPGRRPADRGAGARVHAVHLHRLPADVPPGRRRPLPLRPAGRGGDLRDAGVVPPVAHAGAHHREVPALAAGRGRGAVAKPARPRAAGIRAGGRARPPPLPAGGSRPRPGRRPLSHPGSRAPAPP